MSDSEYLHSSHNVSNLVYHFVTPVKYRRLARTEEVEGSLKQICAGIELSEYSQGLAPAVAT